MQLSSRSDEELVALARRGWPAPFAVLLQRHGATVRAAVTDRSDPDAAVVRTFTRAMQQLKRVDPATPVESWLLALVPGRRGKTAAPAGSAEALDDPTLDALWAELAPRWPRGRAPRGLPTWLRWSLLTLLLVALATVIPYATITTGQRGATPEPTTDPLRAALIEPDVDPSAGTDGGDDATDEDTGGGFGGTAGATDDGTAGATDGGTAGATEDEETGGPDDAAPGPATPDAPAAGEDTP